MDDALKKVNSLIKKFNTTFEIEANITEVDGEQITDGLRIKKLNDDGKEFMDELFETFAQIVHATSDDYELVYDINHGLALARKKITYEIEDD
jgi:hypothetical protein